MKNLTKYSVLFGSTALLGTIAQASTDYGPAIWRPAYSGHWYTSGYGHKFHVVHDMEGYYWGTISYFQRSTTSASVHYCANGIQDTSTDSPAGELTQMVREAYYAWHACCWNKYSTGTEHEGFASNPAWYTEAMYQSSSGVTTHLADKFGFAKDRNHIIGHSEHNNANWVNWVNCCSGFGCSPTCNSHTDPGPYWDWSHYMALVIGQVNNASVVSITYPPTVGAGQPFIATVVMNNNGSKPWNSDGTPHNLGSQNPQDNTRYGFGRVGLPFQPVNPGQSATFTFTATAPTTTGAYPFDWKMVEDGVEWFGATATGTVNVDGAAYGNGTGLQASYFDNIDFTGTQVVRVDSMVNFDWGTGSPDPAIGADTFSARWTGKVQPRFSETYTFYTQTDDGVRLWVNGQLLIDHWVDQGGTEWSGTISLTAGQKYDIQMDYYENGGGAQAKLLWSSPSEAKQLIQRSQLYVPQASPGNGTGLQGDYYDNSDFTAYKLSRTDATVNFDWGSGSPDPSVGADTFSVRWTGKVQPLYSQPYTFYTVTDDGVRLWVNGQLLIDHWADQGGTEWSGTISLTMGQQYDIQMDYYENGGGAQAKLSWSSPSQAKGIIPQAQLYPATTPPTINTQPASQTALAGANVTFTVGATGGSPLSYQWRKNATSISGATASSLTLNNVQTADVASYSVVVSNPYGTVTSANATLTVNYPPSISSQPASQTISGGGTASFSVTASGTAPLGYQWRFNGGSITGATLSSYSKTNCQLSDAGNYDVVISNVAGTVTSTAATLTVNVPPSITTQPASQTVNAGNSASFSVTATGTAPLSYQWTFNGGNITGATLSSYTKSNVQAGDAGNYAVVVSNVSGSVTSANAVLTVNTNIPPSISSQPASSTVAPGGTANFSVTASGTAPLNYQWRFNAAAISGATNSTYSKSNCQSVDGGNYSVVITNIAGSITSADAVLTIAAAPSITTQPSSLTVSQGASATFNVSASGTAPLTYQWYLGGAAIYGATGSSYTKLNAQTTDSGNYSVVVGNIAGSATSANATLTVNVPSSPMGTGVTIGSYSVDTGNMLPTSAANFATASSCSTTVYYSYVDNTSCVNFNRTAYWQPSINSYQFSGRGHLWTDVLIPGIDATCQAQYHALNTGGGDLGINGSINQCAYSCNWINILNADENLANFGGWRTTTSDASGGSGCNTTCGNKILGASQIHIYGARWNYINDWTCLGGYGSASVSDTSNRAFTWGEAGLYLYPALDTTHGNVIASAMGLSGKVPGRVATGDCNNANTLDFKGNANGYGGGDNMDSYGFAWMYTPAGAGPQVMLGSDDGNRVWINGVLKNDNNAARGLTRDQDNTGAVGFSAGWNRIVFKVHNFTGGFNGTVSLRNGGNTSLNEPSVNVFDLGGFYSYGIGYEQDSWYPTIDVSSFYGASNPQPNDNLYGNNTTVTASGTAAGAGPVPFWKVMHFEWGYGTGGDTAYSDVTTSGTSWSHTQSGVTGHRRFHFFSVSQSGRTSFQNSGVNGGWNWADGGPGNFMDVYIDNAAPDNPSFSSVTPASSSQVTLAWAIPLDEGVGIGAGSTEAADESSNTSTSYYRRGDVGVQVYRNGTAVSTWSTNTSFNDTGLAANTSYTYTIEARDNSSSARGAWNNATGQQGSTSVWTLSAAPNAGSVSASPTNPITGANITWTAVNGFGAGQVQYYRYAWDQSATHSWTDSETQWSAGTITTVGNTVGTWYLHVKGYNGVNVGNGTFDYAITVTSANTPPSITAQPQSQTINQGNSATFSVTATGTAPLSYQWRFNAGNIAGATLSSYTKSNAQGSDSGSYSVVITNVAGSVTSANAVLTVNVPPSITTQPANQTVNQGSSATFTVVATGTAPLSYQWSYNGGAISGATASSYTKANAQPSDAGNYSVIITNIAGSVTSANAALTVNYPPSITTQPVSQTVSPGGSATFTVAATGVPAPTYQWRLNGTDISGATSSSYTRSNVQSADVGYYSVAVSNPLGTVTSVDASLTLNDVVVFSDDLESGTLNNWTTVSGATALAISTAQHNSGVNSAYANSTQNKMYHNFGTSVDGHAKLTWWVYDSTLNRAYGEARSYSGGSYGNGGLQQLYAAGKYSSVTMPGETFDATKYQGRVLVGANSGWFNLNGSGAPSRSTGWHKFEVEILAGGTTINFSVDGILSRQISGATAYALDDVSIGSIGTASTTGDAWLDDVKVEYFDPPTIATQPASQTANAGTSVTLSVAANGNISSFQWRKNGVNIPGANASSLLIDNVQQANAGTYSVILQNGIGPVTSANATLTVIDVAPSILTQPQSQNAVNGADAVFSVVATGTTPLSYQWRFNTANISGATDSDYTRTAVQSGDAGSYSVVISNPIGSTTSADAVLTVGTPPSITTQPQSQTVAQGGTANFNVVASGTAPLNYQWRFNGGNISGATTSAYSKANVQTTDAGSYSVVIVNSAGSVTSADAVLTVTVPPAITTQPASQTVTAGSSATFSVVATGTPAPTYQWRKNAANITGATGTSYTISNAQSTDAANYSVVLANVAGSVTSADAVLTVHTPPSITTQPNGLMINQGQTATFNVVAAGDAPLSYQWRFNVGNIAGATLSSYSRSNVQPSDAGSYSVVVTNAWGSVTSLDAMLIVNTAPTITSQPASQTASPGANVTYSVTATGTAPLYYQWQLNQVSISGATTSSYTRNNVQVADVGYYSVIVSNSVGTATSVDAALTMNDALAWNDNFESGNMNNWTVYASPATVLAISTAQNHTSPGSYSAYEASSLNKMYHNLNTEIDGHSRLTYWGYDADGSTKATGQTRWFAEVMAYTGAGYPNGSLQQKLAIGRYNVAFGTGTGTFAGEADNNAKYQGRVANGVNTGWFNLTGAANRSLGWHKFEIERLSDGTTVNFWQDGVQGRQATAASQGSWDSITIGSVGTGTAVNKDAWFDDITVDYYDAPTITTQPSSQTVTAGSNVTFSVTASNATSYQWRFNGINIPGATGSSYTITGVNAGNAGNYTVIVGNGVGPVTSNVAVLTVN